MREAETSPAFLLYREEVSKLAYGKNRALGDYIHYHKSNYEKFGINTGSKKGDNNYGKK